jgi:diguanylate cyclase (GGDEF)-like protein
MLTPDMLERLLEISRQMAETRALDPLLKFAMSEVLEFVKAEAGYLILLDDEGELDFRVKQNNLGEEIDEPDKQISRTILNKVIKKRKSFVIADALSDDEYQESKSVLQLKILSVMCAPLISKGELFGALYVENRSARGVFEDEDVRPLQYFAAHAAVAIENAMLNDDLETRVASRTSELKKTVDRLEREIEARKRAELELHRLAITDPLTNVYNRRYFFEVVENELERAKRHNLYLSIVMVDLDHFKEINDNYGHTTGDQVLCTMADSLRKNLRKVDVVGRFGGDEFVILMPESNTVQVHKVVERIRKKVVASVRKIQKFSIPISASMGLITLPGDSGISVKDFVDRADQALYDAKEAGRDRVSVWVGEGEK